MIMIILQELGYRGWICPKKCFDGIRTERCSGDKAAELMNKTHARMHIYTHTHTKLTWHLFKTKSQIHALVFMLF